MGPLQERMPGILLPYCLLLGGRHGSVLYRLRGELTFVANWVFFFFFSSSTTMTFSCNFFVMTDRCFRSAKIMAVYFGLQGSFVKILHIQELSVLYQIDIQRV